MKNNILLVLSFALMIGSASCTSKKVDSGSGDADAAELTGDTGGEADAAKADVGGDADAKTADAGKDASTDLGDDFGTDDANKSGGDAAKTADAAPAAGTDDLAGLDDANAQPPPPPADQGDAKKDNLATNTDAGTNPNADTTPPPSGDLGATPPPADETQGLSGGLAAPAADAKPVIPLQKMVSAPFTKGGVLANALYMARQGDTLKAVSDRIYGSDKVADLKKVNPTVAHRKLKVGDKIYYNSPQRPADNSQMLTYYEDKGLAPEVYLAQNGDNLHAVGKKLLGDTNSWKELWATNLDVESKGDLAEGTRLRYWSSETAPAASPGEPPPAQNLAANTPPGGAPGQVGPPPPPMPEQAPPANMPPPPPPGAMNAAPPPPPPPVAAAPAEPPAPPPPAANMPPPPPKKIAKAPGAPGDKKDDGGLLGDDPDQMMALGVGVILLLAAAALVIIIRKKRAKRAIDFQTASHTQIE